MRRESAPWPCSKPVAAETQVIHWVRGETAIGPIVLAATARGICHLSIAADTARLIKAFPRCERLEAGPWAGQFLDRVVDAIAQPHLPHDLPLDPQGTEFQHKVWAEVCRIPGGETRSYSSIAATIGRPKAIRAVGTANGANPIAVLIPCHRLVRSNGALAGYAYGLDRKTWLLDKERQET
jgi:AraC family transcriptional regulator of adaptative response/methylated-DNA-[protein]-cysteine methyltransferase